MEIQNSVGEISISNVKELNDSLEDELHEPDDLSFDCDDNMEQCYISGKMTEHKDRFRYSYANSNMSKHLAGDKNCIHESRPTIITK